VQQRRWRSGFHDGTLERWSPGRRVGPSVLFLRPGASGRVHRTHRALTGKGCPRFKPPRRPMVNTTSGLSRTPQARLNRRQTYPRCGLAPLSPSSNDLCAVGYSQSTARLWKRYHFDLTTACFSCPSLSCCIHCTWLLSSFQR
jgi:hypothetical protein